METRIAYYLNGKEVTRPSSIVVGDTNFIPPTDEQLIDNGYEIRHIEYETTPSIEKTYEERVVELIRMRYTIDDELAILRQRDKKPNEFAEYDAYCEDCKAQAKNNQ